MTEQRPDERVDVPEQIDRLAEFLMEHTPVGIYGNMGAIEHAIAHITALQHERDAALARAERYRCALEDVQERLADLEWLHPEIGRLWETIGATLDPEGYAAALSAGDDEEAE